MEQVAQPIKQPRPAAVAAALLASRLALMDTSWLAFLNAFRLAFLDAFRFAFLHTLRLAFMGASRLAGRLAAVVMKQLPESFQEPVAAATSAVAATRGRGGRRSDRGRRRCRLIGACEPGRRYQQ